MSEIAMLRQSSVLAAAQGVASPHAESEIRMCLVRLNLDDATGPRASQTD